jgi:hypothetical protein
MAVKLSDWANVAEVVSGVAVVITLIFLILSIRENTEITRAAAYDTFAETPAALRLVISDEFSRYLEDNCVGDR